MFVITVPLKNGGSIRTFASFLLAESPSVRVFVNVLDLLHNRAPYEATSFVPEDFAEVLTQDTSPWRADSYNVKLASVSRDTTEHWIAQNVHEVDIEKFGLKPDLSDHDNLRAALMNIPMLTAQHMRRHKLTQVRWRGDTALFILRNMEGI